MSHEMFCFQCEQTAGCSGCTGKAGVCGKTANTAKLQDELTGALIGLARAADNTTPPKEADQLILEGLFATLTNVNFDDASLRQLTQQVREVKNSLSPLCHGCTSQCAKNDGYDLDSLWTENEDIRSLKSLLLFGMRGMAAYAFHARVLGYEDPSVTSFFYKGLFAVGYDGYAMEDLLPLVMESGKVNLECMELLDRANRETYGIPAPARVSMTIEKGPFIVISGHDLHDLEQLLKQTQGTGINIYTHGEMLPAHAYPNLRKYPHLTISRPLCSLPPTA